MLSWVRVCKHWIIVEEDFLRKVEVWKETSKFRELATDGGFYSEADMKKPVSEGGLGLKETPGFIRMHGC